MDKRTAKYASVLHSSSRAHEKHSEKLSKTLQERKKQNQLWNNKPLIWWFDIILADILLIARIFLAPRAQKNMQIWLSQYVFSLHFVRSGKSWFIYEFTRETDISQVDITRH